MPKSFTVEEIRVILANHHPITSDRVNGLRPASVLAPFYQQPDGLSLIFTKRTEHLDHHSGQISFPGGSQDADDLDGQVTALRETHEEIGVRPEDIEIWGRLNQEVTITNFSVAPYVGLVPYPYEFILNPDEVERLIVVPLDHLMDKRYFAEKWHPHNGKKYKTYNYRYKNDIIWGATARMVFSLINLITTGEEPEERFIYD